MLTHLVRCLLNPDTLSLKSDVLDNDNSLLSLEAIIAPLKPIKRVKWDTKVCDAGIFAIPEKKGRIISLMIKSENGSNTNNMNIMHAAKFSILLIIFKINPILLSLSSWHTVFQLDDSIKYFFLNNITSNEWIHRLH